MLPRLKPIIKKEFRQIARDRRTLILLLALPAFMLIMYGYALNFDVKHIRLAVVDRDQSPASRDFLASFFRTEYFDLVRTLDDERDIDRLLDRGDVQAALVLPRGFGADLAAGREALLQAVIDGSDARAASTTSGYIYGMVQSYSNKAVLKAMVRKGITGLRLPIEAQPRVWYNPDLKSVRFLVPGLIAFILMVIVVISTAMSVVREKERGTMEQILVSPIRPAELILGKTIPYIVISLVSANFILLIGRVLFGVEVRGDYLTLLLVMSVFLIGGLGMGLLISTAAHTQQVAFMMAVLLTLLPTFLLSGFVFPIRNMPAVVQGLTYFVPSRYFLSALRAIVLKGTGLAAFWKDFAGLAVFALLMAAGAIARFKRIKARGGAEKGAAR
jgi:ABC-2 type transport system permease protein